MRIASLFFLFMIAQIAGPASHAQQRLENHDAWNVFRAVANGKTTCYVASAPVRKEGTYTKRDAPYLIVTYVANGTDEVSTSAGYKFKKNKDVQLVIGTQTTPMFVQGELAWAYDAKSDKAIINQMIRGNELVVKGTSWKDTISKDTYSLKGFTAAYKAMQSACKG